MPQKIDPTCPFCISDENYREVYEDIQISMSENVVHCTYCNAITPISTWNNRPGYKEQEKCINDLQNDIDTLDNALGDAEKDISDLQKENDTLQNRVNSLEGDLFDAREDRNNYKDEVETLKDNLGDATDEIAELKRELRDMEEK